MAILAISLDLILDVVARLFNRTLRINVYIYIFFFCITIYRDESERVRCLYARVYIHIKISLK